MAKSHDELIAELSKSLSEQNYNPVVVANHRLYARAFLGYLAARDMPAATVTPSQVEQYFSYAIQRFHVRYGRSPSPRWHRLPHTAICKLLRLAQGTWPPEPETIDPDTVLRHVICQEYEIWLRGERGLADSTIDARLREARCFLNWYLGRGGADGLRALSVPDVDLYMDMRARGLRRISLASAAGWLRSLLRYLHQTGRTPGSGRRQTVGETRAACLPPCAGRRTSARVGSAKDHRRRAWASINQVYERLPQAGHRGSPGSGTRRARIGGAVMSYWHDRDRSAVADFLKMSRFGQSSCRAYRSILRSFEDVARRHPALDRQMLEAWLKEMVTRWRLPVLLNQVCIVDRFLDYLADTGVMGDNPVAKVRRWHNVKHNKPIWRALASPDPDDALAALRRPAPFGSALGNFMRDHVALMRSRGYQYETQAHWLLRFDRFLQAHPELAGEPLEMMLAHWAAAKPTRNHAAECQKLGRILTKARYRLDPAIPPRRFNPWPEREVARQHRRPHIFSPADIRRMLDVACSYPSPHAPLRPLSLYTMVLLAYCAGLRRGELARLDLGDVDLQSGTITVRKTKFYKTRILPLPDSVMAELRAYLDARRRAGAPQDPQSGLFWQDHFNDRYAPVVVSTMITNVMRRAGFKPPSGRTGPRVHDLRHSMVVNRILQWYRSGINPQDRLRFLSTYMGHRDINSTLVYITVTQDLLQEASERFRAVGAPCLTTEALS